MGDVHGEQIKMCDYISRWEKKHKVDIDFVLQLGDFQSLRNENDFSFMTIKPRHKNLGDFPMFDNGKNNFSWPIYFIGGNHEAYGFLEQFQNGGQLINNCYYLGRANCMSIKGVSIAGLSGIYSSKNFKKNRPNIEEKKQFAKKLLTYFNEQDINQLLRYKNIDILLLHDWPENIDNVSPKYGNPYARQLIEQLKPKMVFCGHIHHRLERQLMIDNTAIEVCCLANLQTKQPSDAFAFYQYSNGVFSQV